MNERTKKLAEQAGLVSTWGGWVSTHQKHAEGVSDAFLERFAELVRQDEREQWTPVEIGVDVTLEGAHVVGMYVLMPEAVRHVFYSQFHPAPKREWVGLTVDEILDCYEEHLDRTMFLHRVKSIEAKIKEKNT